MAERNTSAAALKVGVVGSGVMGAGIAQVAAEAGHHVHLTDARAGAAAAAIGNIASRWVKRVAEGKMTAAAKDAALGRLVATELTEFADCALVIEAIVEDKPAKIALFRTLEAIVAPSALVASNTSSLSITALQAELTHPERFGGLHFFNPVPAMALVEVIPGLRTSPETTETLAAFAGGLGKSVVIAKDVPGFLVNLVGRAYTTEALHIWAEGVADPATIDAIMRECCGFRLGPFELLDLTGLDVNLPVSEIVHAGFYFDPRLKTVPDHRTMREGGLLGRKSGRGFHTYDTQGRRLGGVPEPAAAPVGAARVIVPVADDPVRRLLAIREGAIQTVDDGASPILVSLEGWDASSLALQHGLDARRLVAVDALFATETRVTLVRPPSLAAGIADVVVPLFAPRSVSLVNDSAGAVAQRIVTHIMNLAADVAQAGIAAPADIDTAVTLGLAYPKGPFAWADALDLHRVAAIITAIRAVQGSERYRLSPWLRRRAMLGMSAFVV